MRVGIISLGHVSSSYVTNNYKDPLAVESGGSGRLDTAKDSVTWRHGRATR